MKEASVA